MSDAKMLGERMDQFRNIYEDLTVIVAGSGPGLAQQPDFFLESRILIGLNWLPYWRSSLRINHWLFVDPPLADAIDWVQKRADPGIFALGNFERSMRHDGRHRDSINYYTLPNKWHYSSSMFYGWHLADWMGAKRILVVGFDCTYGGGNHKQEGINDSPHFFDPAKEGEHYRRWNLEAFDCAGRIDAEVVIIEPTTATGFETATWRDYDLDLAL